MHHYVGATTMLIESGAEMRGRKTREPVRALSLLVGFSEYCCMRHRTILQDPLPKAPGSSVEEGAR